MAKQTRPTPIVTSSVPSAITATNAAPTQNEGETMNQTTEAAAAAEAAEAEAVADELSQEAADAEAADASASSAQVALPPVPADAQVMWDAYQTARATANDADVPEALRSIARATMEALKVASDPLAKYLEAIANATTAPATEALANAFAAFAAVTGRRTVKLTLTDAGQVAIADAEAKPNDAAANHNLGKDGRDFQIGSLAFRFETQRKEKKNTALTVKGVIYRQEEKTYTAYKTARRDGRLTLTQIAGSPFQSASGANDALALVLKQRGERSIGMNQLWRNDSATMPTLSDDAAADVAYIVKNFQALTNPTPKPTPTPTQ